MSFDTALEFTLKWEGGYSDNPADRGGRTQAGVTQRVYDSWRRVHGQTPEDVRVITEPEVRAIYKNMYWDEALCGELPAPVDLVHFDAAVNHGVSRATKFLQEATGVSIDGIFGAQTHQAVLHYLDTSTPKDLAEHLLFRRRVFYAFLVRKDPTQQVFYKGWLARLADLQKHL